MNLTATQYKYIELNESDVPYIAGTTMKVIELIAGHLAFGWSPEEIKFQHPYLSMSQIYSALAYYWDNKEQLDADIQERFERVEKLRQEAGESALAKKLRNQGLIK
ncbi:DUF433 domain-containing protein [Roseofilum sp. BLCC_M154]|jgi:uncharacterized protein (DUF433 family)|uniref:DUF433 domain-containing protein n=1 Tax=Roseofilum acuticapitatum BLCC-M154 TaxID=3022444 RepID=A0ABT7AT48_9CYAN|nr:DUF433 domain-containing protein [Roseofilum acuticapitatum]MDJ1170082.1 DUF433 domain-containing protein [Roseofilum acuticapitatum BLCC-M154]